MVCMRVWYSIEAVKERLVSAEMKSVVHVLWECPAYG